MENLSEKIKLLRHKTKLSQKELSEKTGLSIATIQGYEQGKFNPKLQNLEKIAHVLNVPIQELADLEYFKTEMKKADDELQDIDAHLQELEVKLHASLRERGFIYRKLRDELGLSQEDLSQKTGIAVSDIKSVESGLGNKSESDSLMAFFKDPKHYRIILKRTLMEFGTDARNHILLWHFLELNDLGKQEALKRVSELAEIERYTTPDTPPDQPDPVDPDDPDQ